MEGAAQEEDRFQCRTWHCRPEYDTDVGPANYVLFVNKQAVGVIEAKPKNWGQKITTVEDQSQGYAASELKWVKE